jgi:hypothetical protein
MSLLGFFKKDYTPPEAVGRDIDTSPRDTRSLEVNSGELNHRLRVLELEAEIIGRRGASARGASR